MALSLRLMEKRKALFEFWHLGYCASVKDPEVIFEKPSEVAHILSCPFFHAEHPHLRLNRQEIGLVESLDTAKMMPSHLLEEIKAKLATTARESGVPADLILAACYGYVLVNKPATGADALREVMKAVQAEVEKAVK
jgi:hypothetical protein